MQLTKYAYQASDYTTGHRLQLPDNNPEFTNLQAQYTELQGLIGFVQRRMNEGRAPFLLREQVIKGRVSMEELVETMRRFL